MIAVVMSIDPSYVCAAEGALIPGVWFTSSLASWGKSVSSVPAPRIESVEFSTALGLEAGDPRYSYPAKNPSPPTAAATTIMATIQTVVGADIDVGN